MRRKSVVIISMGCIFRFLDHGKQDFQLLRLEGQDLLRVLVDRCRLHVLRQFPEVRREFKALDATPVKIKMTCISLLPWVSKIVAFIFKNIDTIIFYMFNWLAIGWLDPSHMYIIKARTLEFGLCHVKWHPHLFLHERPYTQHGYKGHNLSHTVYDS